MIRLCLNRQNLQKRRNTIFQPKNEFSVFADSARSSPHGAPALHTVIQKSNIFSNAVSQKYSSTLPHCKPDCTLLLF